MGFLDQDKTDTDQARTGSAAHNPVTQMVPLNSLRPHARQAELFGEITTEEVEALAKRFAIAGAIPPVEITTGNVVVVGYAQFLAFKCMGHHSVIPAIVRDDLHNEVAILERFLVAGMAEPGLDWMTLARCQLALLLNGRKSILDIRSQNIAQTQVRKILCKQFPDIPERTLGRYCGFLRAPVELQHALTRKQLSVEDLAAVLRLRSRPFSENGVETSGAFRAIFFPKLAQLREGLFPKLVAWTPSSNSNKTYATARSTLIA